MQGATHDMRADESAAYWVFSTDSGVALQPMYVSWRAVSLDQQQITGATLAHAQKFVYYDSSCPALVSCT